MTFNQFKKLSFNLFLSAAAFCGLFSAFAANALAQFTFMGDYDRSFAAPNGYFVDPQNNDPSIPSDPARTSYYFTGDLNPDGSIIAGGRILRGDAGDFYVRKFTASGAVDTSFGGGAGYVRTTFFTNSSGYNSVAPQVLKRQPDGKILFAGICNGVTSSGNQNNASFGNDVCVVRYNADGTLDQTFGNNTVTVGFGPGCTSTNPQNPCTYTFQSGAGKFTTQSGQIQCNFNCGNVIYAGTDGTIYDIALQPDGKIVLAGETRDFLTDTTRYVGILIRLNANGSLDQSFGAGGIARYTNGLFRNRFRKVLVQPDGRILAAGYNGRPSGFNDFNGFFLARFTAGGTIENTFSINNTTGNETAAGLLLNRDGTKILVSGYAQGKATLARLNIGDLSPDATFGTNGVRDYNYQVFGFDGLNIKAIQPDGKILAVDQGGDSSVVRLNPDGSPDQSFGNVTFDHNQFPKGRLSLPVQTNIATQFNAAHLLLRPDGKLNLIGSAGVNYGFDITRAAVSQNLNVSRNGGNLSDFTNDGKADIAVFRTGNWYYLNSANNQFSGATFGLSGDKPVPADYDGDGKTDLAVYRPSNGYWYILQSSNNQFRAVQFGAAEDLPRPGDFDGDGFADITVFRPSNGSWYYLRSSDNQFRGVQFGQSGDVPLPADFDGDGKSDVAVFRPANGAWYYLQSSDGQFRGVSFGFGSDVPTVGDYDGDGKSDVAVFRPSNGYWYRLNSSNGGFVAAQFGQNGDKPVAADYDNDGKTDLAIFRNGTWYGLRSTDNSVFGVAFGTATDTPIPAAYLP